MAYCHQLFIPSQVILLIRIFVVFEKDGIVSFNGKRPYVEPNLTILRQKIIIPVFRQYLFYFLTGSLI